MKLFIFLCIKKEIEIAMDWREREVSGRKGYGWM